MMRLLSPLVALLLISVIAGCAGASRRAVKRDGQANVASFRGDVDDDETGGANLKRLNDHDADFDNDKLDEEAPYFDTDDGAIRRYGRPADAGETRTLSALVKRYYTAAAKADGATACSLLKAKLARTAATAYRNGGGPRYLRAAMTCGMVLSLLFEHNPERMDGAIAITAVRVEGDQARVLVGSRKIPASVVSLVLEGGRWRLDGLLGIPLQ